MVDFFKFPPTPHLKSSSSVTRRDKILPPSERIEFLQNKLVIEEKLDGANIGISIGDEGIIRVQNRGSILSPPYRGQFSRLNSWLEIHRSQLETALKANIILFGEWCAAQHSIHYSSLPDLFILFDVYDLKNKAFWSVFRRDALAKNHDFKIPKRFDLKSQDIHKLSEFVNDATSKFSDTHIEGIVLRQDDRLWNIRRAKLVRVDFTQSINEHWSKRTIVWNKLREQD
jgi:ATP-dependent RNA circularization protein (DNA/RNA ligase family)